MFSFDSRDTGVLKDGSTKLFASNEKQIDNHTLMLDKLYLSTIVEVSLKRLFGVAVVLC